MVREQKYLFFLCSLFSQFTPGSFFCLIKRRVGRKDRKLVSITCLQGLSCSKSPSRLAFVGSLWGWEAVEYLQNSSNIWQEQERNCRQRSVGLSRKQKMFRAGSHSQVSCMATARRLWGLWTWGVPPPKSRSCRSLRWVRYIWRYGYQPTWQAYRGAKEVVPHFRQQLHHEQAELSQLMTDRTSPYCSVPLIPQALWD